MVRSMHQIPLWLLVEVFSHTAASMLLYREIERQGRRESVRWKERERMPAEKWSDSLRGRLRKWQNQSDRVRMLNAKSH